MKNPYPKSNQDFRNLVLVNPMERMENSLWLNVQQYSFCKNDRGLSSEVFLAESTSIKIFFGQRNNSFPGFGEDSSYCQAWYLPHCLKNDLLLV